MLGAVLRDASVDVQLVDLNLEGFRNPDLLDPGTFYQRASSRIAATGPDVVGFTSMALESHVCLELARILKHADPALTTVFGGAHFGSIACEAMQRYPWMDFVITGEGERPFTELVRYLRGDAGDRDFTNVARSTPAGIALDRQPRANIPIEELPFPAHDLVDLQAYFAVNPNRLLSFEHARGCQLRCSFCYSEAHWGHGENSKSVDRIIRELAELEKLGAERIFFVGDNFVTSRERAERICAAVAEARFGFTWHCYATLAQLVEETVAALERARCRSVFVGVDAVSQHNKRALRKTYFKGWKQLETTIERCLAHQVEPTCSFMLSSNDSPEGIEETVMTALLAKKRGAHICLNALAVYNGSALSRSRDAGAPKYSEEKPLLLYDTPALNVRNDFAVDAPNLFPMHQHAASPLGGLTLYQFCKVAKQFILRLSTTSVRYRFDTGKPITRLIQQVALRERERLQAGDMTPRGWRLGDAAAHIRQVLQGELDLVSVFEHETVASDATTKAMPRPINLLVDGSVRRCALNPHKLIALRCDPNELEALRPIARQEKAERYLVTHFLGETGCVRLDLELDAFVEVLQRVSTYPLSYTTFRQLQRQRLIVHLLAMPEHGWVA